MTANTEAAIWSRVVEPESGRLTPDAAQAILDLDFRDIDHKRISELATRAQEGALSEDERAELESYNRVSHLLALLQSKARLSLRRRSSAA